MQDEIKIAEQLAPHEAIYLTKAQADHTESRMRQTIMSEMDHAREMIRITTDPEQRATFWKHLKILQLELLKASTGSSLEIPNAGTPEIAMDTMAESPAEIKEICPPKADLTNGYSVIDTKARETVPDPQTHPSSVVVPEPLCQAPEVQQQGPPQAVLETQSQAFSDLQQRSHQVAPSYRSAQSDALHGGRPGVRMVSVVAPENLPENYTFEAKVGNLVFLATVPKGGVTKGQVFHSTMTDIFSRDFAEMKIPRGQWRDNLFDCLKYGIAHPFVVTSCFCPQSK